MVQDDSKQQIVQEDDEASPIGDQKMDKRAASEPDSSDNDLMELNQQLPNRGMDHENRNQPEMMDKAQK